MKMMIRLLSSTLVLSAMVWGQPAAASQGNHGLQQGNRNETLRTGASSTMRVVFLPGSSAKNFRFGIETSRKCDVNIQIINSKGMVVYSDVVEKVNKKVEERDFSWLKKGEYTIKVLNEDSEFTKKLVL